MQYRHRHLESRLTRLAEVSPVLYVGGARQAGKSTLLATLFPRARQVVFDPVVDVGGARGDPELFLRQYEPPVILDEVQYAPELLGVIKRATDVDPRPGRYLLTGSQNMLLMKTVSESMAGRAVVLDLPFLSLQERCDALPSDAGPWVEDVFHAEAIGLLRARPRLPARRLEASLFSRLWRGGFPRILDVEDDVLPDLFSSYIRTYVERDVRQLAAVEDQQLFSRFAALCAALSAQEINYSQIGRELGVSYQTAQRWLAVLRATYQWIEVSPYHGSAVKRIAGRPKGYFADTGLASWLQRISTPEALGGHPLQGALFETHVVLDIMKQCQGLRSQPRFHTWRTHGGAEVDLLLERDGCFVPLEIKSASRVGRGDTRGIRAFRETYPQLRHGVGVVVAAVEEVELVAEDIVAVPYDLA